MPAHFAEHSSKRRFHEIPLSSNRRFVNTNRCRPARLVKEPQAEEIRKFLRRGARRIVFRTTPLHVHVAPFFLQHARLCHSLRARNTRFRWGSACQRESGSSDCGSDCFRGRCLGRFSFWRGWLGSVWSGSALSRTGEVTSVAGAALVTRIVL